MKSTPLWDREREENVKMKNFTSKILAEHEGSRRMKTELMI